MFETLFGAGWPLPVQFFVAFIIVLVLIGATFWLIRRFGTSTLGTTAARGRQPRLAVIDAAAVDARRRLVLIRRDNVEHLVMIGGPSDVVIEQNIVRAVPVAPQRELAGRGGEAPRLERAPAEEWSEPPVRPEPARPELTRPEPPRERPQPEFTPRGQADFMPRPQPEAAPRPEMGRSEPTRSEPVRPEPARHEPRPQPEFAGRPEPAPLPRSLRPEAPVRPARETARAEPVAPRAEPVLPREPLIARGPVEPRVPVPPEAQVARPMTETVSAPIVPAPEPAPEDRTADVNLANMAQRLEAALRRPFTPAPAEPAEPSVGVAEPRFGAAEPRGGEYRTQLRIEPVVDEEPETESQEPPRAAEPPRPAPRPEPRPDPRAEARPERQKSVLDSLEEEMASLLGRPPGKE
jgi:hypothetical protein